MDVAIKRKIPLCTWTSPYNNYSLTASSLNKLKDQYGIQNFKEWFMYLQIQLNVIVSPPIQNEPCDGCEFLHTVASQRYSHKRSLAHHWHQTAQNCALSLKNERNGIICYDNKQDNKYSLCRHLTKQTDQLCNSSYKISNNLISYGFRQIRLDNELFLGLNQAS